MDASSNAKLFKYLMVINLDISIWSARKKLTPSDFGGAKLPPEELASLGSKKICNPEDIRIFSTLKSRAVNMLDRIGVRFIGGWGIPEGAADNVIKELMTIHDDFMAAKEKFLASYDRSILDWISQHPEWESIIKNSVMDADQIKSRFGFRWQLFKLVPPKKKFIHDGMKDEVSNLGSTLYGEIAKAAEDTWKRCYSGKDKVSQKAISPLRTIYEKLNGLSFVDPCAAPIADLLKTAFDRIPAKGFIKGADLLMLQGVLALLRDPHSLIEHGKTIMKGKAPESILQNFFRNDDSACPVPADITAHSIDLSAPIPDNNLTRQSLDSFGLW